MTHSRNLYQSKVVDNNFACETFRNSNILSILCHILCGIDVDFIFCLLLFPIMFTVHSAAAAAADGDGDDDDGDGVAVVCLYNQRA